MNVIAFDLSLTATGFAFTRGGGRSNGVMNGGKLRGAERLSVLTGRYLDILTAFPWDLILIESGVVRSNAAFALGELHGCFKMELFERGLTPTLIAPASVKKYATGKGNAGKPEMLTAAIRRLDYQGHDDNEVDALWMLAMGMDYLGEPLAPVPVAQRAALAGVQWEKA